MQINFKLNEKSCMITYDYLLIINISAAKLGELYLSI